MKYLLLICSVFLLMGCTSEKGVKGIELNIVKEFDLTEEVQTLLYNMYTVVSHIKDKEELAFANSRSPARIVITDYNGNLIDTLGSQGRGPNEVESARYFGFDEDGNVVILDKALAFFKNFDRENKTVTSYDYPIKKGISVSSRILQQCKGNWYLGLQMIGEPSLPKTPIIGVFNSIFTLTDTLGGYDPYFERGSGIMTEPIVDVDCENQLIYTSHAKLPFIQVFSIEEGKYVSRSQNIPSSFMLSDKFIEMVTNPTEISRYMTEEQSLNLGIYHSEKHVYLVYRNDNYSKHNERNLNLRDHYVAAYTKNDMEYLGEAKLDGAVLGTTNNGELIVLKDENNYTFQFVEVNGDLLRGTDVTKQSPE
ncbi:MAG: hypothetical protein JXR20_12180 [Balneola sp.]